jgi:acetolactate synthase-1/2/3 large subunit
LAVPVSVGHRLWAQADAVLAIGTRLFMQQGGWGMDAGLKVVRIDIDPAEPDRLHKPAVAVQADARDAAPALLARLRATPAKPPQPALAEARAWMAAELAKLQPQMAFLGAIRNALPEDGIFVDEVTQLGFVARLGFPVTQERTFLSPGYQDNLGWGYGTALGAQAVRPDVPVLAIAGDGGFGYQLSELATAVQHRLPVVVVVFDNGAFFNVKRIQAQHYGNRQIACDLHNPDFARLAELFGMASFRATDAAGLERAVGQALALRAPALVHVPCGDMPSPWHLLQMPKVRGS